VKKFFLRFLILLSLPFLLSTIYTLSFYLSEAEERSEYGVVFGAMVWKGGVPSNALFDRTVSGIELYKSGKVEKLIFSGGFSNTGYWETEVMLEMAKERGVPESDIILDPDGTNSLKTLENLERGKRYTLVSNDFHLGRLNLLAKRVGLKKVQLHGSHYNFGRYFKEPYFFAREVVATLYYLFLSIF
jgi:SanA protein